MSGRLNFQRSVPSQPPALNAGQIIAHGRDSSSVAIACSNSDLTSARRDGRRIISDTCRPCRLDCCRQDRCRSRYCLSISDL